MVINEKALVRQMKEAFKSWGYTVIVRIDDVWVIRSNAWVVEIEGQGNVPNEVLSLIVLHMGDLPEPETAYRVFKSEGSAVVQQEVFEVALEPIHNLALLHHDENAAPQPVSKTKLHFGSCQVWQQVRDLRILLVDPQYERIIDAKDGIQVVGDALYAEGEISKVYVFRVRDDDSKTQIDHLAQMQWV